MSGRNFQKAFQLLTGGFNSSWSQVFFSWLNFSTGPKRGTMQIQQITVTFQQDTRAFMHSVDPPQGAPN